MHWAQLRAAHVCIGATAIGATWAMHGGQTRRSVVAPSTMVSHGSNHFWANVSSSNANGGAQLLRTAHILYDLNHVKESSMDS